MRQPALVVFSTLAAMVTLVGCGSGGGSSSPWAGKTYALAVPDGNWSMPHGIGMDIGPVVPNFLLGVESGAGSNVDVTIASAPDGNQDPCSPTTKVTVDASKYPSATITSSTLPLRLTAPDGSATVTATVRDFTLTDVLPGATGDGKLSATVDVREVYPLFYMIPNADKDSVCKALNDFGAPCQACPQDQQTYCLTLVAIQLSATPASKTITPVSSGALPASCNK